MTFGRIVIVIFLLLCNALLVGLSSAQGPSCESITPSLGTRGKTFKAKALGASLKEVTEVVCYRSGLRCTGIEPSSEEEVWLEFESDATSPLGEYPVRLRTPKGMTELRTVSLSPFDIQSEKEKELRLNRTVLGALEGDEVDTYEIELKAGQLISAEVNAMRLGGIFLDTKISLMNPRGERVIESDDSPLHKQDPCFSTRVKEDGRYRITIRSVEGRADAGSQYALHVGSFPSPSSIFPMGGPPDATNTIALLDHEGLPLSSATILTPGLADGTHWLPAVVEDAELPSLLPFRIIAGKHHNVSRELPSKVLTAETPCVFHGRINSVGQKDSISFTASKSGEHRIEVFASRLGSRLDSILEVLDRNGNLLSISDDFDGLDSRAHLSLEAEQTYTVRVSDKRGAASDLHTYSLEIVPNEPSVTVFLPRRDKRSQARQAIEVPRGNRTLVLLGLQKEDAKMPVALGLAELPAGVSYRMTDELPDSFVVPMVLEASESAEFASVLAKLKPTEPDCPPVRFDQVVDLINGPADALYRSVSVDRIAVAVTQSVPYSIELDTPVAPLVRDGSLGVRVRVHRSKGFELPIEVRIPLLPEWVASEEKVKLSKECDEAVIVLNATRDVQAMKWALVAEAKSGNLPSVSSTLQPLEILSSPCKGSIDAVAAEQGTTIELVCKVVLDPTVPLPLTATLAGLPKRVHADAVRVDSHEATIRFQVEIAEDSPIGRFEGIHCRLSGEVHGTPISYNVARQSKLFLSPKGASERDESGRPLSPLESLRRKYTKT
jgi:hypothetical protein